jgi:pimeloyl-ACP methyl ester carboxylesterase
MESTPIVFVHGLFGTLEDQCIRAEFPARAVVAPDLLGYGELSETPAGSITLATQVAHLRDVIATRFSGRRVHLVGHSAGGAVACLLAHRHPDLITSVVNVEGNFTLRDAFWSASIARMTPKEAVAMLNSLRADPGAWLTRSGVFPKWHEIAAASKWLSRQPASTVRAMAISVVDTTGKQEYLAAVREVFASHPVHLVAGERSREGWDTPEWALQRATSLTVMPSVGHLMMLEDPANFGRIIQNLLRD